MPKHLVLKETANIHLEGPAPYPYLIYQEQLISWEGG
jgi:hypothetical protein